MSKGFTLIELLAAVLILGVLSSIAMPQYRKSIDRARMMEGIQVLPAIYDSYQRWYAENPDVSKKDPPPFSLVDISLKGHAGPDLVRGEKNFPVWLTPNFAYTVTPSSFDTVDRYGGMLIYGVYRKGKYKGQMFLYNPTGLLSSQDGNAHVFCVPAMLISAGLPDGACELLGYKSDDIYEGENGAVVYAMVRMGWWATDIRDGEIYDGL